jgi:hypothetical protein
MDGEMFLTIKQLALAGSRNRHSQAGEAELQRRLADLLIGPELAEKAYGPMVQPKDRDADRANSGYSPGCGYDPATLGITDLFVEAMAEAEHRE